jgi:hypothetical protein
MEQTKKSWPDHDFDKNQKRGGLWKLKFPLIKGKLLHPVVYLLAGLV